MHCGDQRHLGLCLGYVPALAYGSCRVSDQGTTLRASDLHNARATILNPFNIGWKAELTGSLMNADKINDWISFTTHKRNCVSVKQDIVDDDIMMRNTRLSNVSLYFGNHASQSFPSVLVVLGAALLPRQHQATEICVNTLRPRQNGRRFPDDIFNWIFLNEIIWILIKISSKFVFMGPINNIQALVQIMADYI